jgi:hypothetical protein
MIPLGWRPLGYCYTPLQQPAGNAGGDLQLGPCGSALWFYLAVAGAFMLGSGSSNKRSR